MRVGPELGSATEVEVLAVARPGGPGLQIVLAGQLRLDFDPVPVGAVDRQHRIEIDGVADLVAGRVIEHRNVVHGVHRQAAAGMPGGVAELLVELADLAVFHREGRGAVFLRANAQQHLVPAVLAETVAVHASILEAGAAEHNRLPERAQIAAVDPHPAAHSHVGQVHLAIDEAVVDVLRCDVIRDRLEPAPPAAVVLDEHVNTQVLAPVVIEQTLPGSQRDLDDAAAAGDLDRLALPTGNAGTESDAGLLDPKVQRGNVRRDHRSAVVGPYVSRAIHRHGFLDIHPRGRAEECRGGRDDADCGNKKEQADHGTFLHDGSPHLLTK